MAIPRDYISWMNYSAKRLKPRRYPFTIDVHKLKYTL